MEMVQSRLCVNSYSYRYSIAFNAQIKKLKLNIYNKIEDEGKVFEISFKINIYIRL